MRAFGSWTDQDPTVRADASVPFADRTSEQGGIASLDGKVIAPGQQEIVARAVRFCKRNLHLFAMVDVYDRRSSHHNLLSQRVSRSLQGGIDRIAGECHTPFFT